jgi:3-deoxy-manno-octulosonate cytidylyltransferase (CMP-KDO synthetase)
VIPARMGATRFPGKPLVDLLGKPMVQWVWEACTKSGMSSDIYIATPDEEIQAAAEGFGARVIMTRHDHVSGTDRIAEVATKVPGDIFLNVQGDEPLVQAGSIAAAAHPLVADSSLQMGSVWTECPEDEYDNPAVVKVVTDLAGDALYFSRHCIPFPRNPRVGIVKKHLGIYAYRREPLLAFNTWGASELERTEQLEQLRFMEHGVRIRMSQGAGSELAVDTPEQADQVREMMAARGYGA